MTKNTLVLAAASVALGMVALNGTQASGQVPATAPVAAPPFVAAPSNIPVAAPSVAPSVTPTTSPVAVPSASVVPGNTRIGSGTAIVSTPSNAPSVTPSTQPAASALSNSPALGSANSNSALAPTTQPALTDRDDMLRVRPNTGNAVQTPAGEQAIPSASVLDGDRDDMLLHNRSANGTAGSAAPGNQSDIILGRDNLQNNRSLNGTNNSGVNSLQGGTDVTGPVPFPTTRRGESDLGRFVDPNRHDAFQPLTPRRTPVTPTPVTPNRSSGTTGVQPGGMNR